MALKLFMTAIQLSFAALWFVLWEHTEHDFFLVVSLVHIGIGLLWLLPHSPASTSRPDVPRKDGRTGNERSGEGSEK